MARIKPLSSPLGKLAPRVGFLRTDPDKTRRARHAYRAWYGTAAWQRLRWSILVRDLFTCRRCQRVEADTSRLVADHVTPHRGDAGLFWNEANLQCLCKACHDSAKQREERATAP